ncbi:MAG: hypothetical protein HND52_04790 [Ignavibacteriae bacterium]|nr:hypothetical protein [Ignavibacteriota bacterium]NOG97276.1 hypothetical protein [Ignavibacteriota bacterium]
MKIIKNIIFTLSCIVISASCDLLESDETKVTALDSKVEFKIFESYETLNKVEEPKVYIEMKTEKIYGCFNFSILTEQSISSNKIDIQILGIYKPGVCLTALGPASRRIRLGSLSGVYEITIRNNQFNDKYNLLITDSLIISDGKDTDNTKSLTSFLHRYPQNSFAYLFGSLDSLKYFREEFIDTLSTVINIEEFFFSEFASIPYLESSQGHQYDAPAKYFNYESEEDFNRIEGVMKSFIEKQSPENSSYSISIINWKNQKIRSWLF